MFVGIIVCFNNNNNGMFAGIIVCFNNNDDGMFVGIIVYFSDIQGKREIYKNQMNNNYYY